MINQNESFDLPSGALEGLLRQAGSSVIALAQFVCIFFSVSLTSSTKQELLKLWRQGNFSFLNDLDCALN